MDLTNQEIEVLIARALEARKMAYCPRSKYNVGVAVLTGDNQIVLAANVEAETSTLQNCAERLALAKAFLQGFRVIKALAVVNEDGLAPCGTCRQIIYELCRDIPILIVKPDKSFVMLSTLKLLPFPFNRKLCGC